ncbi:MAG: PH domain-containing protein [Phycisphaerae bacterium]
MTPAESASPLAPNAALPEKMLSEGEEVLLATRPSAWSILLTAWPVLLIAIAAGGVVMLVASLAEWEQGRYRPIVAVLGILTAAKLFLSSVQWAGRLYIVTNLRLLTAAGTLKPILQEAMLTHVHEVAELRSPLERRLGLGSVVVETHSDSAGTQETVWLHLAQCTEVRRLIEQAVHQARGLPGG